MRGHWKFIFSLLVLGAVTPQLLSCAGGPPEKMLACKVLLPAQVMQNARHPVEGIVPEGFTLKEFVRILGTVIYEGAIESSTWTEEEANKWRLDLELAKGKAENEQLGLVFVFDVSKKLCFLTELYEKGQHLQPETIPALYGLILTEYRGPN